MIRRRFFGFAALAAAGFGNIACSGSIGSELPENARSLNDALTRFRSLPGTPVYAIDIESARQEPLTRINHLSDRQLLIGSAFKTFIVLKCLQDMEEGKLSDAQLIDINDAIRVNNSDVFINLSGTVQLRSVLDAICAYSDNTASDAAMAQVGADRVRAFIASAGLASTRIPDSIRILESYLSGAPLNTDIGWAGVQQLLKGVLAGTPRPAINNQVSIISTADDLVSYYRRAMRGEFFSKPTSVHAFKHFHGQGNLLSEALPETAIYAKLGNVSWLEFNAFCYPGQMILPDGTRVTFAFAVNWSGTDSDDVYTKFISTLGATLTAIKELYKPGNTA